MENNTDLYNLYGNEYRGSYFKGLKGLSSGAKEAFESQYKNYLKEGDDNYNDEVFRILTLKNTLTNHPVTEIASLWNKKDTELDTPEKRNKLWSQLALMEDLDANSEVADAKTGPAEWMDWMAQALEGSNPNAGMGNAFYGRDDRTTADTIVGKKLGLDEDTTIRNQAREYLQAQADKVRPALVDQYNSVPEAYRQAAREDLGKLSESLSPNYYGRFKYDQPLTKDFYNELYVDYQSWFEAGGEIYANEKLANFWQDYFAKSQTQGEKWANASAKFGKEIVSTAIMAGGLIKGLLGNPGEENQEEYWKGVIDNEWTRYAADLFTTGQWDTEKQEEYKAKGWDSDAILSTVDQERSLLSANTPADLFAQYGFTAASMLLSGGYSGLAKLGFKGVAKAGFKAGLNSISKGRKFLTAVKGAERFTQMMVPAMVAMPEATLEALTTRDESMLHGLENIEQTIESQVDKDILDYVNTFPDIAEILIRSNKDLEDLEFSFGQLKINPETGKGSKVYSDLDKQRLYNLIKGNEELRQAFGEKYSGYADEMLKQLQESEDKTLWTTFGLNAFVLGAINSTLQASQQALGVRRALGKGGTNRFANAVDLVQTSPNKWKALAKNVTKWNIFSDRLKESLGEGLEEIAQGTISAFSTGMADNKVLQYFDARYNTGGPLDAFAEDTWQMVGAGLLNGGQALVSRETFKEGLYGTLSTLIGGPSVNFNMSFGGKREGESTYDMIMRNSPIAIRGIYDVAFSSAERNAKQKENEDIANTINAFLDNDNYRDIVFDIISNNQSMKAFTDATLSGDEKAARDAKVDALFSTISMLSSMRGTGYYDLVVETLEGRANYDAKNLQDENSNESLAVEEFRAKTGSKEYKEVILQEIKDSAKSFLDLMKSSEKHASEIRKIFGDNISLDVQKALVGNRLHSEDREKRIKQLKEEHKQIDFTEENSATPNSTYSKSIKQGFAKFGSFKQAQSQQQVLKQEIEERKKEIANLESEEVAKSMPEGMVKQAVEFHKSRIKRAEETISTLERYLTKLETLSEEERENITLSMQDISELDSESKFALLNNHREYVTIEELDENGRVKRKKVLNPNTRTFSNRQAREIEKYKKRGLKADSKFLEKVNDLFYLEQDLKNFTDNDIFLMQNPRVLLSIAAHYRQMTQAALARKKYEYLGDNNSESNSTYEAFKEALLKAKAEVETQDNLGIINDIAKKSKHWKRYKEEETAFNSTVDGLARTKAYQELDKDTKQLADDTLLLWFRNGIDFKDPNALYQAMQNYGVTNSETGKTLLEEALDSVGTSIKGNQLIHTVLSTIGNMIHEQRRIEEEIASRPTAKPIDENTGNNATPNTIPSPNEESKDILPSINTIINSLEKRHQKNPEVVTALNKVKSLVSSFNTETLENDFKAAIQNAEDTNVKDALQFVYNNIKGALATTGGKSVVTSNPKTNSGEIETFSTTDVEVMKDSFGGPIMKSLLSDIHNFMTSESGYAALEAYKGKLYFYIPSDLEEESRVALEKSGGYSPNVSSPVVMLMPHKEGKVLIGGKKYQPIGLLPAAGNKSKSGSDKTTLIRESLIKDGVVQTDKLSDITTARHRIPGKAPKHLDKGTKNVNVKEIVDTEGEMTLDEFAKALTVKTSEEVETGLGVNESKSKPKLVVNIPNHKGKGQTTEIDVYVTNSEDVRDENGKNIFDYLISGDHKALDFTWRISEVSKILQTLISEDLSQMNESQLKELQEKLNLYVGRYIRFSGGQSELLLEKNEDNTTSLMLSLGSNVKTLATFEQITAGGNQNEILMQIYQNMLLNKDMTAPFKLSRTGQFLIYQVDYAKMQPQEESDKTATGIFGYLDNKSKKQEALRLKHIKDDIQSGMFSVSKQSLAYNAEGVIFSLNERDVRPSTEEVTPITPSNYTPSTPASTPVQTAETSAGQVVEPATGEIIREEKKENTTVEEIPSQTVDVKDNKSDNKYSYSNLMSRGVRIQDAQGNRRTLKPAQITGVFKAQNITKETWENMTNDEKKQFLECC